VYGIQFRIDSPDLPARAAADTFRTIETRLEMLGIMTADQRTTANSFMSPSKIGDTDDWNPTARGCAPSGLRRGEHKH
jgi:hypothetical protein